MEKVSKATYFRELRACCSRFGRIDVIEEDINGATKKIAKAILTCGYRDVEPRECIFCGGFT